MIKNNDNFIDTFVDLKMKYYDFNSRELSDIRDSLLHDLNNLRGDEWIDDIDSMKKKIINSDNTDKNEDIKICNELIEYVKPSDN